MKNLFILLLSVGFLPTVALASIRNYPERTIENVSDGIIVTYNFRYPIIRPNYLVPGSYLLEYMGFGINDTPGEPAIPFRKDMFYIPIGHKAQVSILNAIYRDTTFVLSPAIPPVPNDGSAIVIDSISPYTGFYPKSVLKYGPSSKYREVGLQSITVIPLKYNYNQHKVRIYTEIKYKVTFVQDSVSVRSKGRNLCALSDMTSTFLSNVTLNYASNSRPSRTITDSTWHSFRSIREYLILTTDEYLDSIQDFVKWKKLKGNEVVIEHRPKGWWNPERIKSLVENLYDYIDYLLIIGGNDDVPGTPFTFLNSDGVHHAVTDFYYGLPDSDSIPQIYRGRITGDNISEISALLNKIIQYEKNPTMDESFYKTALHCAEFQDYEGGANGYEDRAMVLTSENIREHLISRDFNVYRQYKTYSTQTSFLWSAFYGSGDPIPLELQPGTFLWNGNSYSIQNIINSGTSYVFF